MTVYRRSDSNRSNTKYFYLDNNCHSEHESCSEPKDEIKDQNNFFNNHDATVVEDGGQFSFMDQESAELIWVKESCNIEIKSTDTQAAVSLQAALQLAIAVVISITIGDSDRSDHVSQELLQLSNIEQTNRQKIYIYNTKDATVTTTDTDVAINIQLLLQVLLTLVVLVDIL
ncbi:spore coat protein [Oceanobacillus sp. Castelsardo]|uniref:spore coat protein n=1 Tax=Oceanobacillus sp. Castelsardo TaxID=1851204 RepID=UPI000838777B|nr:spore coat protein [Oceanobacillus sp. Castelsardo]